MDLQSVKQRFGIIGNNPMINRALDIALRVSATDLSVLVTGESGVGKEFFPQIIHAFSARKHSGYIAVNCGAIPEGTIDSELFGHEKGSFTGATDSRKGYFEMADGGTIFLDEVAELPQTTQVRLLRVLQTGEFIRVGSSKAQKTNVRVVAATNVNLTQAIAQGKFREDLYYRLNTVPIFVPPLRERKEDIYLLFRRFAVDIANQYKMPAISLSDDARTAIENYSWPGNVRQLKNVAEQISVIEESRDISFDILKKYLPSPQTTSVIVGERNINDSNEFNTERELLYSVLFDMRKDMAELKAMIRELRGTTGNVVVPSESPAMPSEYHSPSLIPSTSSYKSLPAYKNEDDVYDAEEITDDSSHEEITKEMVQKEAIIKALKKHGGRRKDAAKELFISERTLYRRIKELNIDE